MVPGAQSTVHSWAEMWTVWWLWVRMSAWARCDSCSSNQHLATRMASVQTGRGLCSARSGVV